LNALTKIRLIIPATGFNNLTSMSEAIRQADLLGLDLVEVDANAEIPVYKIFDQKKFLYEQQKKAKNQPKPPELKEIKFRPAIDKNDIKVKVKKIFEILNAGDKVKISMQFRGRENVHTDLGLKTVLDIVDSITQEDPKVAVDKQPKLEGNTITAMLSKKKVASVNDLKTAALVV
jgi:translation initiation factor IF-3